MKRRQSRELYRGVAILEVAVPRYEVQDAAGKTVKTFASRAAAKAFIDGYVLATKRSGQEPPK